MKIPDFAILLVFFAITSTAASASGSNPQGSVIVRIDDGAGNGRCIGSSDRLTVTLRRVILEKNSHWLGLIEDKELGVTLTTTVNGTSSEDVKTASFAKVVKEQVEQFSSGQISLAQEQSLLNKFALINGQSSFSVIDLEVGIVKTSGKSTGAKILLGAVGATKNLSLPVNPFASAYGVATTYVTSVFEPLLDQAAEDKEAVSHHIVMNINAANCAGDDEKTGTKAIVDAAKDSSQPGYINTEKINSYCFKAELKPAFVLKFSPLPNNGSCDQASDFTELRNSYLAFYVNALPQEIPATPHGIGVNPGVLRNKGFPSGDLSNNPKAFFAQMVTSNVPTKQISSKYRIKESAVNAYREAIHRCQANGTSILDCI